LWYRIRPEATARPQKRALRKIAEALDVERIESFSMDTNTDPISIAINAGISALLFIYQFLFAPVTGIIEQPYETFLRQMFGHVI
jgi:hypothetical protein